MAKSTVDRAGVANEAGSVHRRNVAVYLAVHGLTGTAVLGGVPTFLAFETAHKTDDILCELDTGHQLFISAKRTCGTGKPFKDTVTDWVGTNCTTGDRLVLATAEPKGPVRDLDAALNRRREAPATVFPAAETTALAALTTQLAGVQAATRDRVIEAAAVLVVDKPDKLLCAMLEGTVVPPGHGAATVSHLKSLFHTQAGAAYSGDRDSWRSHLTSLGVALLSGPPGSSHAQWIALAEHRAALASQLGRVDLSLLADDLEPLVVPDLVTGIRVASGTGDPDDPIDTCQLSVLARRVPRLLVEGLPGSGKSTAMVQLAALWAQDPDAPVPIIVRLSELAARCTLASDVTVNLLCDLAAAGKTDLATGFRAKLAEGHTVLLLDGLDECLDKAALVAQGIKQAVSGLPTQTGVVLTTRPGSEAAAHRLALHTAQLATPDNLGAVLAKLFKHIAATRSPGDPESWLAARSDRLRTSRSRHPDIGEVPLLSILVALTIADNRTGDLPTTTAGALISAIEQTITRWENRKDSLPSRYTVRPTKDQLLTGFAAIGRLLVRQPFAAAEQVQDAVVDALVTHWEIPISDATERTRATLWFWDDRNGVFVTDAHGRTTARSRVFAEIGAAQWCPRLDEPELRTWVDTAADDLSQHTALLLAAQIDLRVVPLLLDHPMIAAQALHNGAGFTHEQRGVLLDLLIALATATTADTEVAATKARLSMPVVRQIAELPLGRSLNTRRVEALLSFDLSREEQMCVLAAATVTAAIAEDRSLTPTEVDEVMAALALPLPPDAPRQTTRNGIRGFRSRAVLPRDRTAAVIQASRRINELPDTAAELIASLIPRMSTRDAMETDANLSRNGQKAVIADRYAEVLSTMDDLHRQLLDDFRTLLGSISRLSAVPVTLSSQQRWRVPTLNQLLHALGFSSTAEPHDLHSVTTTSTDDLTDFWLRTAALAAGLDLDTLAAEARSCLPDATDHALKLACVRLPREPDVVSLDRLDKNTRATLPALLGEGSTWMAATATEILWEHADPDWFSVVTGLIPNVAPPRRRVLADLAISLSSDTDAQTATYFASIDPPLRCAAAAWMDSSNPLHQQALRDADASVRQAAGAAADSQGIPPPRYRSCLQCTHENPAFTRRCAHCD